MLNSPVILWNFFNSMVHDSRFRSLHCVLDGLDECSAEAISFITQRLDELNSTDGFPPQLDSVLLSLVGTRLVECSASLGYSWTLRRTS
jgi:hypothetical protein